MADSRPLLITLGILLVVALLGVGMGGTMMGPGMMGPGMMWGYGSQSGGTGPTGWNWGLGMAFGWLAMLAFWGAIIVGIALLVRWLVSITGATEERRGEEASLAILRRRYAAGEIDQPTYQRMREEIQEAPR